MKDDNIINKNEKIFNQINDFLSLRLFGHIITYENAIKELKSIELDKESKEKDSLLEGI